MNGIMQAFTGKGLASRRSILDWGGGCGRVSRYIRQLAPDTKITLGDIDSDNVAWCQANLTGVETCVLPLYPPSLLETGAFDTVIGNSVFTHLSEDAQFAWLEELRRVTEPGGLLLVTVHNLRDLMRMRAEPGVYDQLLNIGFIDSYIDPALTGRIDDESYYRATFHTHSYIRDRWCEYFEVLDIIPEASNNHQDIVVMRRP